MKKLIGNLLLAGLYIASWETGKYYGSPKVPFCVTRNDHVFKVERVSISLVTDKATGSQGFIPADPEEIRSMEKEVSCPNN